MYIIGTNDPELIRGYLILLKKRLWENYMKILTSKMCVNRDHKVLGSALGTKNNSLIVIIPRKINHSTGFHLINYLFIYILVTNLFTNSTLSVRLP